MAEQGAPAVSSLGRVADYLFGRNTLIGIASLMLLVISGYATWSGMSDFIIGVSTSPAAALRDIPGGLSVSSEALIIAIVVALTFLMWLALRESFGVGRNLRERLVTFPLYIFLALWSVGFGYGFWWSLIAGEEATRTGLSGLQEDARDAGTVLAARLAAVRVQLDNVVTWSESQMQREETSGGSCGVPSGAGRGPLYNARRSVRDAISSLRDGITGSWLQPVQTDIDALQQAVAGLEGDTVAERQQSFEQKAANVRSRALNIASRSNELGKSTASEMRALAETVSIEPGKVGFSCYDPTLANRLRQAADQAAQPAELKLREAAFNEGPAGVANAVKNLWTKIGAYITGLPSFLTSGGDASVFKTGGEPITGRDMIALLATLGVDLGLFVLMVLNPPSTPPVRHRPSPAVIRQVRSAIETAIKRAPNADMEWVRRHFIHHNKASYMVLPNLFAADPSDEDESAKALAMNQLAGVLDDLDLVRWPHGARKLFGLKVGKSELQQLADEEVLGSDTDLMVIRKKRLDYLQKNHADVKLDPEKVEQIKNAEPLRNHGVYSKAERVLEISGWSEGARRDIEIFVLEDTEGLTPLLAVLNDDMGGATMDEGTNNDGQQG